MFCFMYCAWFHVLYLVSYIAFCFMHCVLFYVLHFASCIVFCFMYCILLHALCSVLCIACCFVHAKSHFGHIPDFLGFYIQNFFVFKIDKWCFPLFLDIKSLTFLIYIQFSSDSIPFSHTLSLILDISCHFLFFISNFYPAQFFFHLHCS